MPVFEITQKSHDVVIDLKYGTLNNFTHQKIYDQSLCFLHNDAKNCFEKAIALARQQGLRFKIFDAYRPQAAQEKLWEICPNPMYVAPPTSGSNHTRGVAIDLTLINEDGTELDMGTPFDDFTEKSHHGAALSRQESENRYILLGIMMSAGWDFYHNEWWHYQLFNAKSYPLLANSCGIMTK
ncbi:MAG: D-alanyl-D-alanine dipeptidase [Alphaproteobacteria bacterium]|nr:D-alanyl-D-alanine dipeptidase [Alphaproteobacteria bacterium]